MIVAPCFEGDEDMALMGVQHDLYFAHPGRPEITIDGMRTLGWIWNSVVSEAERRRQFIPWIDRHFERIWRIDRFSHKLLQLHHQHIAPTIVGPCRASGADSCPNRKSTHIRRTS